MSVIFHVSLKFHQANSAGNILKDLNAYFLHFALFLGGNGKTRIHTSQVKICLRYRAYLESTSLNIHRRQKRLERKLQRKIEYILRPVGIFRNFIGFRYDEPFEAQNSTKQ